MPTLRETVHHSSGTYVAGCVLPASHELVKAVPHLFGDDDAPVIEAATAAPGEVRATRRPAKKSAPKG